MTRSAAIIGGGPAGLIAAETLAASGVAVVSASRRWSLALPLAHHFIEVVGASEERLEPDTTGIAAPGGVGADLGVGLQIGETFIVGGRL